MKTDLDPTEQLNPSQAHYDNEFNKIVSSNTPTPVDQTEPSARRADSKRSELHHEMPSDFSYDGDKTRENILKREQGDTEDAATLNDDESSLYSPDSQKRGRLARILNGSDNNNKNTRKKITLLVLGGASGIGFLIIGAIMIFMFVSGFGINQVAEVAKGYTNYRLNRIGSAIASNVIYSSAKLKGGTGLSKSIKPSSLLDKYKGFDIERVLATLEKEGTVTYKLDGGVVDSMNIGEAEIKIPREGGASARVSAITEIEDALSKTVPELADSKFVGKTANGLFERVGIERVRWTDGVKAKLSEKIKPSELRAIDNAEQLEKVRQSPPSGTNSNAEINAARNAGDDAIKGAIEKGALDPVSEVVSPQVDAITKSAPLLATGNLKLLGDVVEGASTVAAYTLCTIDGISSSAKEGSVQSDLASQRQGAQINAASDQYKSGNISAKEVGVAREALGDFSNQGAYQRAGFNKNWSKFPTLQAVDRPIQNPNKGFMKILSTISSGVSRIYEATPVGWVSDFSDFCSFINNPLGGVVFGVGTGAIESFILNAIAPGAGGATAKETAVAIKQSTEKLIADITEKGVVTLIKDGIKNKTESFLEKRATDGILKALWKKYSGIAIKTAAVSAATVGTSYVIIKMANSSGGLTYAGVSEPDNINKSYAGFNNTTQNIVRTRYRGVPLSDSQVLSSNKIQIAEHHNEQMKKSFFTRMASLSNPYSVTSQIASAAPYNTSTTKSFAFAQLNPLAVFQAPQKVSAFVGTAINNDNVAYAADEDVDLLTDGVQQWGFTERELSLVRNNDEYGLDGIMLWGGENEDTIDSLSSKYGDCYKTETQMSDIMLSDSLRTKCLEELPEENQTNSSVFKWRLFESYGLELDDYVNLQTITSDNATSSSSQTATPGEITDDSSGTPCAAGTDDLGIRDDAYTQGRRIKIRICAINSISAHGNEATPGDPFYVEGANNRALASSIASGAWQRAGEDAAKAGNPISVGSSWRTMAHQEDLCRNDKANGGTGDCPNGNYNDVAQPGHSNHQAGTAMDISSIYESVGGIAASKRSCSNRQAASTKLYQWLIANAPKYGLKQYSNEAWHWGTSEAC